MAEILKAKTASEVVRREWAVPVDSDDAVSSVSLSASGVTVDSNSFEGNTLVLTLSAGTAGATGSITATVTTDKSRTLIETLYVPVITSASHIADTARSYVDFALRKVVGVGKAAESDELDDALERLEAMLAAWRAGGADIGAAAPITANTVIYCPDWAVKAIRYNLLLECAGIFGYEPTFDERMSAKAGLQLVRHNLLPDERKADYY